VSQNPFATVEMVFWLMGSLADRSLPQVWLAAPFMLAGIALLLLLGRARCADAGRGRRAQPRHRLRPHAPMVVPAPR
jgi:hypothetical protein